MVLAMFIITDFIIISLGACIVWMLHKIEKTVLKQKMQPVKQERKHAPVAMASFQNALNPYDQYKDKQSQLYVPRKPKGGIEIKPMGDD